MIGWAIAAFSAIAASGIVWYLISDIKVKAGWQHGSSPLARWLDERRRTKFEEQLPEALATLSNALRAGFSISQAFESVVAMEESPISEEFDLLRHQLQVGMGLEQALESMSERIGSDDLTLVTTAIIVSRRTGGNVTEIFDKISATIRDRAKVGRKIRTLTAQGRMQGIIVSIMPIFLGIVLMIVKPGMMMPFVCSYAGLMAIMVMFVLIAVGWLMIRKIIRIDV